MVVLDASITIARYHQDEITPKVNQVFWAVETQGAVAPPFWKVEIANVLQMNVRKLRYDEAQRDRLLQDIAALPVTIDNDSIGQLWTGTLHLAHRHRLTVYDAIYLECALRNKLPLATLDRDLRAAAAAESLSTLGI